MNCNFDTIIYKVSEVDAYSYVVTEQMIKISTKPIFKNKIKLIDFRSKLEENKLTSKFIKFALDDEAIVYYELYNGYRMSSTHYYTDINSYIKERFYTFLFSKITLDNRLEIFYLKTLNKKTEAPGFAIVSVRDAINENGEFIDEKGYIYLNCSNVITFSLSYTVMWTYLVHEVVEDNLDLFKPGSFVYEEVIKPNRIFHIKVDNAFAKKIVNTSLEVRDLLLKYNYAIIVVNNTIIFSNKYDALEM